MKIHLSWVRLIVSFICIGFIVPFSAPLCAAPKNTRSMELEQKIRQFKQTATCAFSKEGCSSGQIRDLTVTFLAIILLMGIVWYFTRKPVPGAPREFDPGIWKSYGQAVKERGWWQRLYRNQ